MAKRKSRKSDRWLLKHIFAPKPERQKSDPERARREEELFLRMDRIIASEGLYLNKNLSLAMIAREVGTNRTYLSAVLRNRDFTFSSYLGSFRVQRVLQLLADPAFTGVDAADIAEMSGFMSDRTMNYYLTATMGVTFSSIRRRTELMAGDKSSK